MDTTADFSSYRRNLPHWQVGGSAYFITFRAMRFLQEKCRAIVRDRVLLGHGRKFELFFGVVMHDHVHLLLRPLQKNSTTWFSLAEILQGIKGSSAHDINKLEHSLGPAWQSERFDRLIRNETELQEKWEYIWNNPIKAGLSDGFTRYDYYIAPTSDSVVSAKIAG